MTSYDHVRAEIRDLVEALPDERISFLNLDQWIPYTAADRILDDVEMLIKHPRNVRMPCRIIIGEPDNGKTTLLKQCVEVHPPMRNEDTDAVSIPAFMFQMPPVPDEGRLYSEMLTALHIAHREDAPPERLKGRVIERLQALGVRVLLGDEFHNLTTGSAREQRIFLAALKNMLNDMKLPLIAAGTPVALTVLAHDPQFATRFSKHSLPPWSLDKEALIFLATLETFLPLAQPSGLSANALAPTILAASKGSIGGIRGIVRDAAIIAIGEKSACITEEHVSGAISTRAAMDLRS